MEREENIRDNIIKLPKVELHCHLDGSLSREFVEKRLGRTVQEAELSVSDDCTSLAQYLEKFDLPGQCIQDEKGLEGLPSIPFPAAELRMELWQGSCHKTWQYK